jgi:uncharacterized protein YukE
VSIAKHLYDIGNGIRSGISDVPSLVTNIFELNVHGVATDSRKVIGDVGDVLNGAAGLGVELGSAPIKYAGSLGKWADSPVLSGAQLIIEGQKKLTGDGDIDAGGGYGESSVNLEKAVQTLLGAQVDADAWDGAASKSYDETNNTHRRHVSNVSAADNEIGKILKKEADQVRETREVLDSTSQLLYDYGLATKAALAVPGVNVAKFLTADLLMATTAVGTTTSQMAEMVAHSFRNAWDIRKQIHLYDEAKNDTSGDGGPCGTFVDPTEDRLDKLPTRLHADTPYTPRNQPPVYGPPATPLPVESEAPRTYGPPADLPTAPHITPPTRPPAGLPK